MLTNGQAEERGASGQGAPVSLSAELHKACRGGGSRSEGGEGGGGQVDKRERERKLAVWLGR
jgi:hypothetical protein